MRRIRFRSPLRAVVYESRGLFLWWGVLAAATSALLLWCVRLLRPGLFAPAAAVALAAWSAPLLAVWSLLTPLRPDSLPAEDAGADAWRKALRALARFLIYQETRGSCDRGTKALLRDGEKRVRAALRGVHGARQLQAAWHDVRKEVVDVWADAVWQRARADVFAIAREAPLEGADPCEHRSSRNWRAAREVFSATMPQILAVERSRWEIRCEVLAFFCTMDGLHPGVPAPVLSGLFALLASDLSLPWDSVQAIERIRPWAEREARLLAVEGFAEPAAPAVPAAPAPLPPPPAEAAPDPAARHAWTREAPESGLGQDPTTSRVPPRPVGTVHFSTHGHGVAPSGGRRGRHRHSRRSGWKRRFARDIARVADALATFAQRLRYTFRVGPFG